MPGGGSGGPFAAHSTKNAGGGRNKYATNSIPGNGFVWQGRSNPEGDKISPLTGGAAATDFRNRPKRSGTMNLTGSPGPSTPSFQRRTIVMIPPIALPTASAFFLSLISSFPQFGHLSAVALDTGCPHTGHGTSLSLSSFILLSFHFAPLRRLHSLQSIWQLEGTVRPPSRHGVTWSASISESSKCALHSGQIPCCRS